MRKTLITLMALAGVAVAGEALTLPDSDDFTWIAGSNASGIGTGSSAAIIENLAAAITADNIGNTDLTGWFGGTGQAYVQSSYPTDISITSSASFSFKCRPALSGEYVALGLTKTFTASSITLTFTTDKKLGYSLWSYDGTTATATELIANTYVDAAKDVSVTYDAALVEPSQLFVVWTANHPSGNAGNGQTVTVSNIGISYIPEPATATLSLLALAGLAARRRRK